MAGIREAARADRATMHTLSPWTAVAACNVGGCDCAAAAGTRTCRGARRDPAVDQHKAVRGLQEVEVDLRVAEPGNARGRRRPAARRETVRDMTSSTRSM